MWLMADLFEESAFDPKRTLWPRPASVIRRGCGRVKRHQRVAFDNFDLDGRINLLNSLITKQTPLLLELFRVDLTFREAFL